MENISIVIQGLSEKQIKFRSEIGGFEIVDFKRIHKDPADYAIELIHPKYSIPVKYGQHVYNGFCKHGLESLIKSFISYNEENVSLYLYNIYEYTSINFNAYIKGLDNGFFPYKFIEPCKCVKHDVYIPQNDIEDITTITYIPKTPKKNITINDLGVQTTYHIPNPMYEEVGDDIDE